MLVFLVMAGAVNFSIGSASVIKARQLVGKRRSSMMKAQFSFGRCQHFREGGDSSEALERHVLSPEV